MGTNNKGKNFRNTPLSLSRLFSDGGLQQPAGRLRARKTRASEAIPFHTARAGLHDLSPQHESHSWSGTPAAPRHTIPQRWRFCCRRGGRRAAAKAFYKRDRILKKRTARGRGAFSLSSLLSFCGQFVLFSAHIISWPDLWQRRKGLA